MWRSECLDLSILVRFLVNYNLIVMCHSVNYSINKIDEVYAPPQLLMQLFFTLWRNFLLLLLVVKCFVIPSNTTTYREIPRNTTKYHEIPRNTYYADTVNKAIKTLLQLKKYTVVIVMGMKLSRRRRSKGIGAIYNCIVLHNTHELWVVCIYVNSNYLFLILL